MEPDFWHTRWNDDRIGFHQSKVNKQLSTWWPELSVQPGASVFVPLCGKSLDLLWLHGQGHSVIGIELSEKAVAAFFEENGLPYEKRASDGFIEYAGIDAAQGISVLVGDFFALAAERLSRVQAFYDRASLIAMNDSLRTRYARHLGQVLPAGTSGLLLAIDYDPSRMKGPPFAVPDEQVRAMLGDDFRIEELFRSEGPERLGNLKERGLDSLVERTYRLQRRAG